MSYEFKGMEIPEHMIAGLRRYVDKGLWPGGFLNAILENNLVDAVSSADHINLPIIPAYVAYLFNEVPSVCWGSPDNVSEWYKHRGMEGVE